MIAIYLPQYRDELPTIGEVVNIDEEGAKVEVEWYVGSYTGVWRVCTQRKGRATVPWRETIPKESIHFPVNFTKSHRLLKSFIIKLKETYKNKL